VLVVALGACGPAVDGSDDGDGEDSSDEAGSASHSGSASGSSSASSSGSATTSETASEGEAEADSGSTDTGTTTTATATVGTFTDDGPPPPEGGEIGEGGDCSCCGSSLHVSFPEGFADFTVVMSSQSHGEISVSCPEATAEGLDPDTLIQCGISEFTLVADGFADNFGQELWTVTVVGATEPLEVQSECEYGPGCDCNCIPTDCVIAIPSGVDDG